MLVCLALLLFNTLASIATPCSVKGKGKYLIPLGFLELVTDCDELFSHSIRVS